MDNRNTKTGVSKLLCVLAVLFTTGILMSNILAAKQLAVWKWSVPAGTLIFPVSYIVSDIISEVYGYKASRKIAWLGFAMNLLMVVVTMLAIILPAPVWFEGADAFAATLGSTWRLLLAGFIAYHFGSWINDVILSKMKLHNRARGGSSMQGFGARAILSSIFGEIVDSAIFAVIAFLGTMSVSTLIAMIITQTILKVVYEVIILPVTHFCVKKAKEYEGGEVFDDGVTYKIFVR